MATIGGETHHDPLHAAHAGERGAVTADAVGTGDPVADTLPGAATPVAPSRSAGPADAGAVLGDDRPERPYLSIGEVLEVLKVDFEGVSIAQVRELESRGLFTAERTASGYRKFYDADLGLIRSLLDRHGTTLSRPVRRRGEGGPSEPLPPGHPAEPTSAPVGRGARERGRDSGEPAHRPPPGPGLPGEPERRHPAAAARRARAEAALASLATDRPGAAGDGTAAARLDGTAIRGGQRAPQAGAARRPGSDPAAGRPSARPARDEALGQARGPARDAVGRLDHDDAADLDRDDHLDDQLDDHLDDHLDGDLDGDLDDPRAGAEHPAGRSRPLQLVPPPAPPTRAPEAQGTVASGRHRGVDDVAVRAGLRALAGGASGVSLSVGELASASGLTVEQIHELESQGLVRGRTVFSETFYDEDALLIAHLAKRFLGFGLEPRHLRMFRLTAEREAAFYEQLVTRCCGARGPRPTSRPWVPSTRCSRSVRSCGRSPFARSCAPPSSVDAAPSSPGLFDPVRIRSLRLRSAPGAVVAARCRRCERHL